MSAAEPDLVLIRPSRGWLAIDWKSLWEFRELLYFLVWRDIKVKYQQALLGVGWAILQPFFTMVVFSIVFGSIAKIPSDGVPYPMFSYAGLLLWTYFSGAVLNSSNSLVGNANLITKVYFPRLIVPLAASLSGVVDYGVALLVLFGMMGYYGFPVQPALALLPVVVLITLIGATGIGLWFSAMNVRYRDVRYVLPYFLQILLFATPIIYPASLVGSPYRWLMMLNPASGLVEFHRACFLAHQPLPWNALLISAALSVGFFIAGLLYFRRTEGHFADIV